MRNFTSNGELHFYVHCEMSLAFRGNRQIPRVALVWTCEETELMRGDSVFYMSLYRMPALALQQEHEQAL